MPMQINTDTLTLQQMIRFRNQLNAVITAGQALNGELGLPVPTNTTRARTGGPTRRQATGTVRAAGTSNDMGTGPTPISGGSAPKARRKRTLTAEHRRNLSLGQQKRHEREALEAQNAGQ